MESKEPPMPEQEEKRSQAENHQPPDLVLLKTTNEDFNKNIANVRRIVLVGVIVIILILLGIVFYNIFPHREKSPNASLIEFLETQRKAYDSIIKTNTAVYQNYIKRAEDRQRRDSLSSLQVQNRLIQSINNFKPQYEKIPSYADVSKDSLRRLHADRFR